MLQNNHKSKTSESGNVFLFILIGIVLFAALSYTMSSGMRGEGTERLSAQKKKLIIQEILAYHQSIQRGFNRLIRKGCSETQISFFHESMTFSNWHRDRYNHANAPIDFSCHIFHPNGGNVKYIEDPPHKDQISTDITALNSSYHYVSRGQVVGIGDNLRNDPAITLGLVTEEICTAFNQEVLQDATMYQARYGGTNDAYGFDWLVDGGHDIYAKVGLSGVEALRGQRSFCIQNPDDASKYVIIMVFWER